VLLSLDFVITR